MRRLVAALMFLMLVNEGDPTTVYSQVPPMGFTNSPFAPFGWVEAVLFEPLLKVRPFDFLMLAILIFASTRAAGKAPKVRPMRNALLLSVATVAVWFAYGVATGGDARAASWQVILLLGAALASFTIATVFVTPAHYEMLAKTIIAAAAYRAVMCWVFFVGWMLGQDRGNHDYITAHDDSVVWVIAILVILRHALSKRSTWTWVRSTLLMVLFLGAIQFNNRRLAWVSLVMGLVVSFYLLPRSKVRDRVVRFVAILAPIIGIYAAVGWGRTERIFAPLASLASVSTQEDQSTKARNVENLGLIETARQAGTVAGTGWGHPYIEVSNKYSIARFMELWQYIPHNSVLGMLAFTGFLGFAGWWIAFPTAAFLNARVAKMAPSEPLRNVGFVGCASMIVCANQMYGDMGTHSVRTMYLLAVSYAVALRMPLVANVWSPGGATNAPARAG